MVRDHFKISNDERGITITGGLAWAIVVALCTTAFWFGTELRQIKSSFENLEKSQRNFEKEVTSDVNLLDTRLRIVERSDAQLAQIVDGQTALLRSIDNRLQSLDRRLRSQEQGD